MRRFLASALVAGVALTSVALATPRGAPFRATGVLYGGSTSGFWGDRGAMLGCFSGRHYSFTITVRNRSRRTVTLIDARGPNPLPRVIDRVAMQARHAPPPPKGEGLAIPLLRHWSAAPLKPVAIRPGHSAVVQSNFLIRHCNELHPHQKVTVPGTFVLTYRVSGRVFQQHVAQKSAGFSLVPGELVHSCRPVSGSVSLTAFDIGCELARKAATACHHMAHGTWGECMAGGRRWGCSLHSSWVQQCSFEYRTSRWYRVRWPKQ